MAIVKRFDEVKKVDNNRQQNAQQRVKESSTSTLSGANAASQFPTAHTGSGQMSDLAIPHDIRAKQEQLAKLHEQTVR